MSKLTFEVDSALLREIGERLVEKVHIALVELIKNGYDADATEVKVSLIKSVEKSGKVSMSIQVADDGHGMTFEDLKKYWMRIATTNKENQGRTKRFGRFKTGAKGIGRFCCRRLGKSLVVETTAAISKNQFEKTTLEINWDDFVPGTDVTAISCNASVAHFARTSSQMGAGTKLTIRECETTEWSEGQIDLVRRKLAALVGNRGARIDGYKDDPGFNVYFSFGGKDEKLVDLRREVISASWGSVKGEIDSKGTCRLSLEALEVGHREYVLPSDYPDLAGTEFRFGILPDNKKQLRKPKLLPNYALNKLSENWGGIQVRHNGFRIFPYGDDDWLGIDRDRALSKGLVHKGLIDLASKLGKEIPNRALLSLLSNRSYLGEVDISPRAIGFQPKINREGFIESPQVKKLAEVVRFAVDWSTVYRDWYIRKKVDFEHSDIVQMLENTTGVLNRDKTSVDFAMEVLDRETKNFVALLPEDTAKKFKETFSEIQKIVKQDESEKSRELQHLRLVASTSSLLVVFAHEVKSLLGLLDASILQIETENTSTRVNRERRVLVDTLRETKERLTDLIDLTSLIGMEGQDSQPKKLSLLRHFERASRCFSLVTKKYKIELEESIDSGIQVGPIKEAELYAVILNLLSNAIKATIGGGGDRRISVSATKSDGTCRLIFRNSGVRVDLASSEELFEPFMSDPSGELYRSLKKTLNPEDYAIVGQGTGLGLSIVRSIVSSRGGSVSFVRAEKGWQTQLEVSL